MERSMKRRIPTAGTAGAAKYSSSSNSSSSSSHSAAFLVTPLLVVIAMACSGTLLLLVKFDLSLSSSASSSSAVTVVQHNSHADASSSSSSSSASVPTTTATTTAVVAAAVVAAAAARTRAAATTTATAAVYSADLMVGSLDILSIGSATRPHFLDVQRRTFGSHPAVRDYYPITEEIDADAACATNLTDAHVRSILSHCNATQLTGPLSALMKDLFLWDTRKKPGWLCAQKRPLEALSRLLAQYKLNNQNNQNNNNNNDNNSNNIPNYVILMDDDTYLANMERLTQWLWREYPPDIPSAVMACPVPSQDPFLVPWGGYGSVFTKAAIQNFMHPIHCDNNNNDNNENSDSNSKRDRRSQLCCDQLDLDYMGEKHFFRDGMSVAELMFEYSARQPFTSVDSWNNNDNSNNNNSSAGSSSSSMKGFCMHSDHALAYFINTYYIALSDHATAQLPDPARPLLTRDGYITMNEPQCKNNRKACNGGHLFCHYMTPDQMDTLYREQERE